MRRKRMSRLLSLGDDFDNMCRCLCKKWYNIGVNDETGEIRFFYHPVGE